MLSNLEIKRKIMHVFIGLLLIVMIYFQILSNLALFLLIIAGFLLSFICKYAHLPFFSFMLKMFEREEQKSSFPGKGMLFLFIGALLVLKLFEERIALAAIMILVLGDSVSHLYGAKFGRTKNIFNGHSQKLLEGTFAGTVAGFIGAAIFVPIPEAFLGSLGAMIAEVVRIDLNETTLDDNMIVPLVAGTVMYLVMMYL